MVEAENDNNTIKITFNLYELSKIFNAIENKYMAEPYASPGKEDIEKYHDLVVKIHRCLGLLKARNRLKGWPRKRKMMRDRAAAAKNVIV